MVNQNLTKVRLDNIIKKHIIRGIIFLKMSQLDPIKENVKLRELNSQYTENEFSLQEDWGFTKDPSFHLWYTVPHCSCKKTHLFSTSVVNRLVNPTCLVHGKVISDQM